jgi:ABC-type transporter Mla MlaB component
MLMELTVIPLGRGHSISADLVPLIKIIDSSGLGLLLSAFNSLRAVDGSLSVVNASPDMLDLCRILRINQHFPVSGA